MSAMPAIPERFQAAADLHRRGAVDDARRQLEGIVAEDPRHLGALNALGVIALQSGQPARAIECFRRALAIDPSQAPFLAGLAEAHRALGQLPEAIDVYRQFVERGGEKAEQLCSFATLLAQAGRLEEAIASYRRALALQPENADIHFNLGCLLQQRGLIAEAVASYRAAVQHDKASVRAWLNLGTVLVAQQQLTEAQACFERAVGLQPTAAVTHCNLGNALQAQDRLPEAIVCYRRALEVDPKHIDTLCNLGNALRENQQVDEALETLQTAVALRPNSTSALCNLGVTLRDLGRIDEARKCIEEAVRLEPREAMFRFNRGLLFMAENRPQEAVAAYNEALALDPRMEQAYLFRGLAQLQMGQFAEGWEGYEHRVRYPRFASRNFPQPVWDGSPLGERTLMIYSEQAFGDVLQFIRYLKDRLGPQDKIVVAVPSVLIPLLAQSGYRNLVSRDDPLPPFDTYVQLLSLPYVIGTGLDTLPCDVPYLRADAQRTAQWADTLSSYRGLRIGIAWHGRRGFYGPDRRSIPLECFGRLARLPDVHLLSVQKGAGTEEMAAVEGVFEIIDLGPSLDNSGGAFLDTVAVMMNLDLVITSDTSIAHLAGALAVPVWLALRSNADWRWLLDREDCPWYPTMRLFRQTQPGDWDGVFEHMANALREVRPKR